MPRASDSPYPRASDSASVLTWASDPDGPQAWASDPAGPFEGPWPGPGHPASDSSRYPATDPAWLGSGRGWRGADPGQSLRSSIGLGAALDVFCAGKAAEGLSPRTIVWYRMIGERLAARFGAERPVDSLTPPELRAWLVELRATLAPISVAGYVRGLRVIGNWLAADGLAAARAVRGLARPRVPRKLIEPLSDADLRRLLAAAQERDRAIVLLLLDTGLRVSELVGIRLGDLRPDGGIKVTGKGAAERIVPAGAAARRAVGAYLATRGPGAPGERLFLNQAAERLARRQGTTAGSRMACHRPTHRWYRAGDEAHFSSR